MKNTLFFLLLTFSCLSFAQTEVQVEVEDSFTTAPEEVVERKPLTRKERKQLKRSLKKLQKKILSDEKLAQRYLDIIQNCHEDDIDCQRRLEELGQDSIQGTALDQAAGTTFGICKPQKTNKQFHQLVYGHRVYDCKLSSHGVVYNKTLNRKIYGPGLFWDKQSIVMFCTGPAYGKKLAGWALSAGAGIGVTATTVFGSIGACISVGAGTSAGALIGVDSYRFSE